MWLFSYGICLKFFVCLEDIYKHSVTLVTTFFLGIELRHTRVLSVTDIDEL
jgi:hypothetical protein